MTANSSLKARASRADSGFSLLEVMIAIVVMSVGLMAVIASLVAAFSATQSGQLDLIARQKALEALESIYTARNSQQIPFAEVANQANGGIFVGTPTQLLCPGNDGLEGTADDVPCTDQNGNVCPDGGAQCMVLPGPDGILGTADDVTMSLGDFRRTITITPVKLPDGTTNQNMMAITVSVSYTKDGMPARTYNVNGLISSYH